MVLVWWTTYFEAEEGEMSTSRPICEHCRRQTRTRYDCAGWYVCRRCYTHCNLNRRCRWENPRRPLPTEKWVLVLVLAGLLAGCASALPTQTVNGIAVYVRDRATVEAFCYNRLRPADRAPRVYGCYSKAESIIMVEEGHPEVLAHELRHARGWDHRGPCHSTREHPDGLTLTGTPCEWFR